MPVTRITRHESTRSDISDASACSTDSHNSAKKVSFNKAVRIKKYKNKSKDTSPSNTMNGEPSSEKKFWFKVYKNRYNEEPYIGSDVSVADSFTQTPPRGSPYLRNNIPDLHESQFPSDPPPIPRHLVRKLVDKFNEEAAIRDLQEEDEDGLPYYYYRYYMEEKPDHPNYYVRSISPKPKEKKENPLVSGVKVIFGRPRRKKDKFLKTDDNKIVYYRGPYTTKIAVPDDKEPSRGRKEKRITYIDVYPEERQERPKRSLSPPASRARSYNNESSLTRVTSDNDLLRQTSTPKEPVSRGRKEKRITYIDVYPEEDRQIIRKRSLSPPASRARTYTNESLTRVSSDDDLIRSSSPSVYVEKWRSGDQLVLDSTDFHRSSEKTDEGEFLKAVGENHQVWQNETRTIVYEDIPPKIVRRRKAKSQNDLSEKNRARRIYIDNKWISTDDLNDSRNHETKWINYGEENSPKWGSLQRDKETQCGRIPNHYHSSHINEHQDGIKERVIRSSNGYVSAFSNVPSLPSSRSPSPSRSDRSRSPSPEGVIYSQVDKSKKKKNKKFTTEAEVQANPNYDHLNAYPPPSNASSGRSEREVKSSKRIFGFKLKNVSNKNSEQEKNWYDVDADVESVEKNRRLGKSRITEIREADCLSDVSVEAADLYRNEQTTPNSVIREADFKKGEISYENVPRQESTPPGGVVTSGGLWFRDADEDYRREMAQSEVAFPPGSQVGNDKYSSLGRLERVRRTPSPTPRSRTLDRLLLNDMRRRERSPPGVKVLLNGKEMDVRDTGSLRKKNQKKVRHVIENKNPSSVQSDPTCVRGGLAAAYQARQRAALKRSKSSAGGITRSRNHLSPQRRAAVGSSAASSSDSESAHRRRTLVMYIPGISHQGRKAEEEDERLSGANISRSQSMLSSRPPKYVRNGVIRQNKQKDEIEEIIPLASDNTRKSRSGSENRNIGRRHSIPKNTKFPWFKWRLKGKPSREP